MSISNYYNYSELCHIIERYNLVNTISFINLRRCSSCSSGKVGALQSTSQPLSQLRITRHRRFVARLSVHHRVENRTSGRLLPTTNAEHGQAMERVRSR